MYPSKSRFRHKLYGRNVDVLPFSSLMLLLLSTTSVSTFEAFTEFVTPPKGYTRQILKATVAVGHAIHQFVVALPDAINTRNYRFINKRRRPKVNFLPPRLKGRPHTNRTDSLRVSLSTEQRNVVADFGPVTPLSTMDRPSSNVARFANQNRRAADA